MLQDDQDVASPLILEIKDEKLHLERLSDYDFSIRSLPTRAECVKKYIPMLLTASGILTSYWGVTESYNQNHQFSKFEADSNLIGVDLATGPFLVQSVDLALGFLNDLAGVVPEPIKDILEVPPESVRQQLWRRTKLGAGLAGVPFFIIALNNPPPPISKIQDDRWRTSLTIINAICSYLINVGLHILPVAVIQDPQFAYYLFLFTGLLWICRSRAPRESAEIAELKELIHSLEKDLAGLQDTLRKLIQQRVANSLNQAILAATAEISWRGFTGRNSKLDALFDHQGIDRLLYLMEQYPPEIIPSKPLPGWMDKSLRVFGAHLQLGAGVTWWTNVFPAVFKGFSKALPNTLWATVLNYFFAASLGTFPSFTLIVLLAFFGEMQVPQFFKYIGNVLLKMLGRNPDFRLLPPEAVINLPVWFIFTLANGYISAFAPVNAKSVNEAEYQGVFPPIVMYILNEFYANISISMMTFMALHSLYYRYQTEISAVFGELGSKTQRLAHALVLKSNLPKHIGMMKPAMLHEDLTKITENEDLATLLGADINRQWLKIHERLINEKSRLLQEKREALSLARSPSEDKQTKVSAATRPLNNKKLAVKTVPYSLSACISGFFNCFSCCKRNPVAALKTSNPTLQ